VTTEFDDAVRLLTVTTTLLPFATLVTFTLVPGSSRAVRAGSETLTGERRAHYATRPASTKFAWAA
jgi:hypothetical protein